MTGGVVRRAGALILVVGRAFALVVVIGLVAGGMPAVWAQDGNDGFFADEMHRPRITTDLTDEIYDYLEMWEDRGYLRRPLPYLRPYPLQVMQDALEDVVARAPRRHSERAEEFLRQIDREPGIHLRGEHLSEFSNDGDYFGYTGGAAQSAGYILDNLSIAGRIGLYLVDQNEVSDDVYPAGRRNMTIDYMRDDSELGALGREFLLTASVQGMAGFGSDTTYAQVGLTRSSYGPFYDSGVVLSPGAPHAGHFSFTHRSERFTYQHLLLAVTATKDDGRARDIDRDGFRVAPNKFVVLHGLTFHLLDWLDVSLHESITYGQRFDPMYLIPTSVLIYNQILYGEKDSAFIGFTVNARLPHDLAASTTFYLGDIGFGDLARGNLDTRYKWGWQTGTRWTPFIGMLERVSADYTMILPYTYTHRRKPPGDGSLYEVGYDGEPRDTPDVNYQNYTHHGQSLVDLDPNSDRIRVNTRLRPHRFVTLHLQSAFMRHANATREGHYKDVDGEDLGTSDGSVNDPGYRSDDDNLFDQWRFMTQDVIERIVQLGFDAEITLPVEVEWFTATRGAPGALTVDFGYTFEYGWNRRPRGEGEWVELGVDDAERLNRPVPVEGNDGARHYGRFGFSLAY